MTSRTQEVPKFGPAMPARNLVLTADLPHIALSAGAAHAAALSSHPTHSVARVPVQKLLNWFKVSNIPG